MELSTWQWIVIGGSGLLIGLHKTGVKGVVMFAIPATVAAFGAKVSVGIMLPMLIVGDIVAVFYYRRHVQVRIILQLLPWALIGIGIGVFVGDAVSDLTFRRLIAGSLIVGLGFSGYREFFRKEIVLPRTWLIAALFGTVVGFSSMVGNAAILISLYFLAMGLRKNELIGTGAWLFLILNSIKVPLHIFVWGTISWETLQLNLLVVPAVLAGAALGLFLVRLIPEHPYRIFILSTVTIAAVRLMI